MATYPDVNMTISDGALGLSAGSIDNQFVVIGTCSKFPQVVGPSQPITVAGGADAVRSALGYGPLAELAAAMLTLSGGQLYAVPANPTPGSVGQITYANRVSGVLYSSPKIFTTQPYGSFPLDRYPTQIAIAQGGVPGIGTFTYALDDGTAKNGGPSNTSGQILIPTSALVSPTAAVAPVGSGGSPNIGITGLVASSSAGLSIVGISVVTNGEDGTAQVRVQYDGGSFGAPFTIPAGGGTLPLTNNAAGLSAVFPEGTYSTSDSYTFVAGKNPTVAPGGTISTLGGGGSPNITITNPGASTAASTTGSAGPFNITPGQHWDVAFETGGTQVFTFNGTRASKTGGAASWGAGGGGDSVTLNINGTSVTVDTSACSASELSYLSAFNNAFLAAGLFAIAEDDGTGKIKIISGIYGTSSQVHVTAVGGAAATTTGLTVSAAVLGTATVDSGSGATSVSIANLAAATATELATAIGTTASPALAHGTITAGSGALTVTSATTGTSSSVQVKNTSTTALGFTNTLFVGTSGGPLAPTELKNIKIKVSTGNPRASAQVDISYDGGMTYTTTGASIASGSVALEGQAVGLVANFPLGTYALNDYWPFSTGSTYPIRESDGTFTGIMLCFPTGTYVAQDTASFVTTAPSVSSTDLNTQLDAITTNETLEFSGVFASCFPANADDAQILVEDMDAAITAMFTNHTYAFGVVCGPTVASNAVDGATPDDYGAAFLGYQSPDGQVSCVGGMTVITSALTKRQYVVNNGFPYAYLLAQIPVQQSPGWIGYGAVPAANAVLQSKSDAVAFNNVRIPTTRYVKSKGIFFVKGPTLAPDGSDYMFIQNVRVIRKACSIAYKVLLPYLEATIVTNRNGTINEQQAQIIESDVNNQLTNLLVNPGNAISSSVVIDRTVNLNTSPMKVKVRAQPFGYASEIDVDVGFEVATTTA